MTGTRVRLGLPFARLDHSRAAAALLLAVTVALVLYGLVANIVAASAPKAASEGDDSVLYQRVIDRVHAGERYHPAVVDEQRQFGYPLHPFVTVRPPALAVSLAALPGEASRRAAIALLAALAMMAWAWRLRALRLGLGHYGAALLLIGLGLAPVLIPRVYFFHEAWAGLLIALSLAMWGRRLWWPSVVVGLAAALVREHAAAYLVAMLVLALRDRRWTEAGGWSAALALWALALAAHADAVAAVVRPTDFASPGWAEFNGWAFAVRLASWNVVGRAGPWVVPILLPLSLLGLLMLRCGLGERVALTAGGYIITFMVLGRDDNSYWGLLIAPLWPLGVVFAPAAIMALLHQAAGPGSASPWWPSRVQLPPPRS